MKTEVQETSQRKLATIQRISEFRAIRDADRIQVALLDGLGWECVVKTGDFSVGQKVVYIEIDSKVPEIPAFEFLRERKFKVKTIKLRKQVSQGLVASISVLPRNADAYNVGDDVTKELGVTNYVKSRESDDEAKDAAQALQKSKVPRFLMDMAWFRWVYFKLNSFDKGWPSWIQQTDEKRIQVIAKKLMEHYNEPWEITEKSDGQSATYFTYFARIWGFKRKMFGVCSRTIWLKKENESSYWRMARKYDLANILKTWKGKRTPLMVVQGEIVGPKIQKNKYGFEEARLLVFNLIVDGIRQNYVALKAFCELNNLLPVPLVAKEFVPAKEIGEGKDVIDVVRYMVELSKGKSTMADRPREGIVVRLISDPTISFKVINPDFALKEAKDEETADKE